MILVTFTHGIGNFHPTDDDNVKLLETIQDLAESTFPGKTIKTVFLAYEDVLEKTPVAWTTNLAAKAASTMYLGTPAVGDILTDYGTDILQYYLERRVRSTISRTLLQQLVSEILKVKDEPIEEIIMIGHSLGSLALLRLLHLIGNTTPGGLQVVEDPKFVQERQELSWYLNRTAKYKFTPFLIGSPAFSRIKGIKLATNKMALKESPTESCPIPYHNIKGTFDPLSGDPADVTIDCSHTQVENYCVAVFQYLAKTRGLQNEPKEQGA